MRHLTLFPLQGHWGKYAGAAIAGLSLIAAALLIFTGTDIFQNWVAQEQQQQLALWGFSLGLFLMSFSKEKVDDERVQQVRYTAFRGALMMAVLMPLFLYCPLFWEATPGPVLLLKEDAAAALLMNMVVPLLIFQVVFHIGLLRDPHWAYNDLGAEENIKKNLPFFLYYTVFLVLLLAVLIVSSRLAD